jgi:integrase
MAKIPLNENSVKTIRRMVQHKPLHSLLLNLGVDLMLRASDLLRLKVQDVITENGVVKESVKIKQQKTGKSTIDIPLSDNSKRVIQEHLLGKQPDDYIFVGNKSHYTRKPISTQQYQRIIKGWCRNILGMDDVSNISSHTMRKTKASAIYAQTKNVEAVRRLLGQSSVVATSAYLGVSNNDATDLAKSINI